MIRIGTWNLENLFRPGGAAGPADQATYDAKLSALADTVNRAGMDVLGVQEVGDPAALDDLVRLLDGSWYVALSARFDSRRPIRVGVLSRHPVHVVADTTQFPDRLAGVQVDDDRRTATAMGRGALAVRLEPGAGPAVLVVVCHLKSKLLSYPAAGGDTRFNPVDEGERARYAAYALYRRTAEAVTVRALVDSLLGERGRALRMVLAGDLNDGESAATTQILHGPPGSEIGTAGFGRPDGGDGSRLWNLAPRIPAEHRYSRVYRGRRELIDHLFVSHALLEHVKQVDALVDRPLPSMADDPTARRTAADSDHAPVLASLSI